MASATTREQFPIWTDSSVISTLYNLKMADVLDQELEKTRDEHSAALPKICIVAHSSCCDARKTEI